MEGVKVTDLTNLIADIRGRVAGMPDGELLVDDEERTVRVGYAGEIIYDRSSEHPSAWAEFRPRATFIASAPADVTALLGALESVLALAEEWRYKGEFGWGAWQEGHGPDETGTALDHASSHIRAAVVAALGEEV